MKPTPIERATQLAHIAQAIAECGRVHDEQERREAARALDIEDHLPDPQDLLPLSRAA